MTASMLGQHAGKDWLSPCPGCGRSRSADAGHALCRECEGYAWPVNAPTLRDINEDGEAECWLHGVVDCWQSPCSTPRDGSHADPDHG